MKTLLLSALTAIFAVGAQAAPTTGSASQKTAPDWIENAVIYEANLRQGTPERNIKGLQKQLPRLKDLGVDIIWLMPIHPISEANRKGTLGSYYAVRDYKEVNPEFGTVQDLREFVHQAHLHGMKVILDEVCNHTGCDNAWIKTNPDFYAKNEKGEMYGPFDWTDTYKLDYSNPKTREAMTDALKFWITETDIDGYRCVGPGRERPARAPRGLRRRLCMADEGPLQRYRRHTGRQRLRQGQGAATRKGLGERYPPTPAEAGQGISRRGDTYEYGDQP